LAIPAASARVAATIARVFSVYPSNPWCLGKTIEKKRKKKEREREKTQT
jgi:hypothetical protein